MLMRLLWKEWREGQWKVTFGLTVSWAFAILLFRVRLFPDLANAVVISMMQVVVMPLVVALDLFAGEMSHRTIHLLFKLPVPRWKIFAAKILTGLGQVALVFVSTALVMELMGHGRETDPGMLFRAGASFGLCAAMLLVWFSVFSAQSRSEAGSLVALVSVVIGWAIVLLWAGLCNVHLAVYTVPYAFVVWAFQGEGVWAPSLDVFVLQGVLGLIALLVAGYRYVKIRRSL